MQILELNPELKQYFSQEPAIFAAIMQLKGEVFRSVKERETLRFVVNGKVYFIKKHFGIRVKDILKSLLRLQLPVLGAKTEWLAIKKLTSLGIPTMVLAGYGQCGSNPLRRQSFVITEELQNTYGLRDIAAEWYERPLSFKLKLAIIAELARIARVMHTNGINHCDFYLAHFLADKKNLTKLYVIDLHRAQIHKKLTERWKVKDIAALYFSAKPANLTKRDLLRFISIYFAQSWQLAVKQQRHFLKKVAKRAEKFHEESIEIQNVWIKQQNWRKLFICEQKYFTAKMQELLLAPDYYIKTGELLKQGAVTTVTKIKLDNKELIIKRYNIKNFWHWVRICILPSRAINCWRKAQFLQSNRILTPKPIAMIENRFWFLRRSAYYITEYVAGKTADKYFPEQNDQKKLVEIAHKMVNILLDLKRLTVRHGDMKATNFIVSDNAIYLIDLDGMRNYWPVFYNLRGTFARDKKRFLKNWQNNPKLLELFTGLLK
jgi:heptose I phosphotransferase